MLFEELDYQKTPLGELVLQRRQAVELDGRDVVEVKLNDEYLMSSLFVDGEEELTRIGLNALQGGNWDVVVGGLGLGFTAACALAYPEVQRLTIVEALAPVIDWHQRGLVPNGESLTNDNRCRYHHADFFELARTTGFDPDDNNHCFDAILLDIDHTPDELLNPSHADFYSEAGMQKIYNFLKPGGVFALWSTEVPDADFLAIVDTAFDKTEGHTVTFPNPVRNRDEVNGVYIGQRA